MITIKFKKNWRYFNKDQIIELDNSKSIIFVGDNGCGKSSLMLLIYINSLRNQLKKENKDYNYFDLSNHDRDILGTVNISIFDNFDDICEINDSLNNDYTYFNLDCFNLNKIDNTMHLSTSQIATHMSLIELSHGESCLNQIFNFIDENNGKNKSYIFDEPDANISIKHAIVFGKYFNENSRLIVSLHHPYTINQYKKVYWIQSVIENEKRIGTKIVTLSGKDYVNTMIESGCKIAYEQLGISISREEIDGK